MASDLYHFGLSAAMVGKIWKKQGMGRGEITKQRLSRGTGFFDL
jgi:hypothetical protein